MNNSTQNSSSPFPGLSLSAEAQAQVQLAAHTPGNQLPNVEEIAQTDIRGTQQGRREEALGMLDSSLRKKTVEEGYLADAKKRVRRTEQHVIVKGKRSPMGLVGWVILLLLLIGLAGALWIENGAAAQALLSVGAFDVDTLEKARMIMLTPVVVGIALVLGYKVLPPFVRRPFFIGACSLLVVMFLTWATCFAIQSERFRNDASQGISLGMDSGDTEGNERMGRASEGGWSAWLMFGCLTTIMALTTFIGHTGVEHAVHRFESWETNPDYNRALDDVRVHEHEIGKHEKDISQYRKELAALDSEVHRGVVQARTLYLRLREGWNFAGHPPIGPDQNPPTGPAPLPVTPPGGLPPTGAAATV